MNIHYASRLGEQGADELVPSRYAVKIGKIDVLVSCREKCSIGR